MLILYSIKYNVDLYSVNNFCVDFIQCQQFLCGFYTVSTIFGSFNTEVGLFCNNKVYRNHYHLIKAV